MKFVMNDRDWEIIEVDQNKMRELEKDDNEKNEYYGLTVYNEQIIYLWEKLPKQQKRQTLIHELFHCYLGVYVSFQDLNLTEEVVCNLTANSHDIIHEIVERYFDNEKK